MRNGFSLFVILFVCAIWVNAQTPVVSIEEDYTKPASNTYKPGDEYHPRSIENGMYVSKPGSVLPAELSFPYAIDNRQGTFKSNLDMEFTLVKVKGKPEDFIFIHIYTQTETPYLNFAYNELGEWKLGNYLFETIYQSGKTEVKPGTNVVRIEYIYGKLRYFINDVKVTDFEYKGDSPKLAWQDVKIEAMRKQKTIIGLDKLVLKAYSDRMHFSDDAKKIAADAAIPKYREVPEHVKHLKYIKFKENDKWGMMNNQGLVLAPAKYDELGRFGPDFDPIEDGYARVKIGNGHGFIDSTGKEVTKTYYLDAHYAFYEGLVGVKTGSKWGFVNTKGETVLAPEFTYAAPFSDGLAIVSKTPDNGSYFFPNKGAIDKTGKVVIELKYEDLYDFVDGLAPFFTTDNANFGFIDKIGKVVVPQRYDFTDGFDRNGSGCAPVKLEAGNDKSWGLIDKTGKTLIPHQYNFVNAIAPNVAYVQVETVTGNETWLVDFANKPISKKYTEIYIPFHKSGVAVVTLGKRQGVIDKSGKEIVPVIYDVIPFSGNYYFNEDGTIEFTKDGQTVKFDTAGNVVK